MKYYAHFAHGSRFCGSMCEIIERGKKLGSFKVYRGMNHLSNLDIEAIAELEKKERQKWELDNRA